MKDIITVTNQKGGIGKSTTAHALGAAYSLIGYKTLLIDLDAQSNLTIATGAQRTNKTAYEVLTGELSASATIQRIKEDLYIIPATNRLSGADMVITQTGKEYRLKEAIEPIRGDFDIIIIDTPPALGTLTINALTTSNKVIIPAQADVFSLEAIKELSNTIAVIQKYTNPALTVTGILLTRYQPRSILTKELTELIQATAETLNTKVIKARIREAVAIKEAQAMHTDIFSYAAKSKVAKDYKELFAELTGKEIK